MTVVLQGSVLWAWLDPAVGKEQAGRRPVVVVSSEDYNALVTDLLIVVPVSNTDRGWPNHVPLTGEVGTVGGFAMTEQPRAVRRERCGDLVGIVDSRCLDEIKRLLADFIGVG